MSLSATDKLVLHAVILQARRSIEEIAKQTGIRSHVVRRVVARLEEQRVLLGVRAYVNPYPLGLQAYQLLFSIPHASAQQHATLTSHASSLEGISLLSELSGDPQYEMHILARNSDEVLILLDSLQRVAPTLKVGSLSMVHEQLYSGAFGSMMREPDEHQPLRYGPIGEGLSVDDLDHNLLSILANESIKSHREIAQLLGCPVNTVTYRVNKLEERGLIAGYYHLCDFKPLGIIPAVGLFQSSILSAEARERLIAFCNRHPVIAYLDLTVGTFSARTFMRAESFEDARQVMQQLRETMEDSILSIAVLPQLRFVRHSTYPFSPKVLLQTAAR